MSLDPPKSDAELLAMLEERTSKRVGYVHRVDLPPGPPTTITTTYRPGEPLVYVKISDWPITLHIPWSCLISDNRKLRAARRGDQATVVLTPEYRTARDRIKALAEEVMAGRPPAECPLSLLARVYVPNNHARDVVNFSKALHDAMQGVVFTDDRWLYDIRWIRAGVDVDAPRAELTIAPLAPSPAHHGVHP